jgi:short-subunit dehydrogenase
MNLIHLTHEQRQYLALEFKRELQEDADFITDYEKKDLEVLIAVLEQPNTSIKTIKTYPLVQDKSILITGASQGSIGYDCAEYMQTNGWKVYTTVRRQEEYDVHLEKGWLPQIMDYCDSDSIEKVVNFVADNNNGKLGALFNNGGYCQYGYTEDIPVEALKEQYEANVLGWIELTEKILPVMKNQGYGRIIMHGSILGNIPLNYRGAYNSTKSFIKVLTNNYRNSYTDIGFSLIETGPVRSKIRANSIKYFRKYINENESRFRDTYLTQIDQFLNNPNQVNPFTEQPISVAMRLLDAVESETPRARYMISMPTYTFECYKQTLTLDQCLSMSWLDSTD